MSQKATAKKVARWLLTINMAVVGVAHFVMPDPFVAIVPPQLPAALALVYVSGVFEIVGGIGLIPGKTRVAAGWGLIALFVAVFPANIYMAVSGVAPMGTAVPPVVAWGRLPFQLFFIAWARWVSKPD